MDKAIGYAPSAEERLDRYANPVTRAVAWYKAARLAIERVTRALPTSGKSPNGSTG